ILATPGTDLGDDHEILGIGMERLADELVRDVRTIEVAGIDVVHARGDGLAEDGQRRVTILRWAEHAGPGELHGTVAEPLHDSVAEAECAGFRNAGHDPSPLSELAFSNVPTSGRSPHEIVALLEVHNEPRDTWATSPSARGSRARAGPSSRAPMRRRHRRPSLGSVVAIEYVGPPDEPAWPSRSRHSGRRSARCAARDRGRRGVGRPTR